jgi:magnesium transporter
MLKIFKNLKGNTEVFSSEQACWVHVIQPSQNEISRLINEFGVPEDIIKDILDADERPRFEYDEEYSLVLLRIPVETADNGVPYHTLPLGVFMTENFIITICSSPNEVLPIDHPSLYKENNGNSSDTLNFIFRLFLRSAIVYLNYLKQINQHSAQIEQELQKSARNLDVHKLLKLQKCLVYFITSLKSNENVLTKIRNSNKKSMTEINEDMLEDAIIENKQALDMAQIYSDIQGGIMKSFNSFISNNLNVVMKRLTSISIILMIPTLVASLYGMNVPNYLEEYPYAFPGIILSSSMVVIFVVFVFKRKKWF